MTEKIQEAEAPAEVEFDRKQLIKLLVDLGPLIAFIVAYKTLGIFWATGAAMAGTLLAVAVSYILYRQLSAVIIITATVVCVFGALTFWFNDPRFAYVKPTIINSIFAAILAAGLLRGRSLMKIVLGDSLQLTDEGWRTLTVRWAVFFAAMAVLNEIVWRFTTESTWAYFKFPGMLIITLGFGAAQAGVIKRCALKAGPTT
jgi:intracellular septation protein